MPAYSLQLFRHLLDQRPVGLSDDIQERGEAAYKRLAVENADADAVETEMIAYGKEAWAYRQAEQAFETALAPNKKETFFLAFLPDDLKEKWESFTSKGGSIDDIRHGESFEQSFTPEENVILEKALVEAEALTHEYLERIAREEAKEQYERILKQYREEQHEIEEKITALRSLIPEKGEKWDAELEEAAIYFERGLAEIEERPTVEKVQAKIDWYEGQVETGNVSS